MDYQPVLVWLSCHRDYFRFRVPELASLLTLYYTTTDCLEKVGLTQHIKNNHTVAFEDKNNCSDQPLYYLDKGSQSAIALGKDEDVFIILLLPLQDVKKIASQILNRSVLVKGFYHLWAKAPSYETIQSNIKVTPDMIRKWINPQKSFSFLVKSFGHCLSEAEKIQRMSHFSFLFTPDIIANIKNPDTQLVIFEKWQRSTVCDSPTLQQVFLTRTIDAIPSRLPWFSKYSLKSRPILGPTTLDHELSFLMANQAKITNETIVLDPFCGTGSLLLAASHFGALTIGGDIDSRVLKGWGVSRFNFNVPVVSENTSIFQNFIHYQLPVPEILRIDIAAWTRYLVKPMNSCIKPWIDVILTDPPYGVRACVRQVSSKTKKGKEDIVDKSADFIPATCATTTTCVINSLLDIASLLLVDHGLLVFLCPVIEIHALSDIKALKHPDLKLNAASLQTLSKGKKYNACPNETTCTEEEEQLFKKQVFRRLYKKSTPKVFLDISVNKYKKMLQGNVQQEALRGPTVKRKRSFRFQSKPFVPYSNEKECLQQYTMYDFYNSFSKEYFHHIMQLPTYMRYAPPWRLGMHTNWLINDNVNPKSVCQKDSHTPLVFQEQWAASGLQDLTHRHLKTRQKNVTDRVKESCSGVLTTTATIGVSSDKLDLSSKEEACCLPRWSASSEIHTSGTSVEKVITQSVQLYPTTGSKKTSLSLEVLQELDKHYSKNMAPWIVDDFTILPVASSKKSVLHHSPKCLNASAIGTTCSSHGECVSNCMNTAFLLHVKDTVARKQMQSKEALRFKKNIHPHLKCEQAASEDLLSHDNCVSFTTPYPACKNGLEEEYLSERSDRSTVAGKVNFKRPRHAVRVKLSNERILGKSCEASTACPSIAWNAFVCDEKKRPMMMHCHSLHTQDQLTCDSRLLPRQTTVTTLGQASQHLDEKLAIRKRTFLKYQNVTQRCKKSVTFPSHQQDAKKLTKQYQCWLMEMLKELQKQRDMGLIIPSRFERKKRRVLNFLQSTNGDALSIVKAPLSASSLDFFSTKNRSFQSAMPSFSAHTLQAKKRMFPSMDSFPTLQNPTLSLSTNRAFCQASDIVK